MELCDLGSLPPSAKTSDTNLQPCTWANSVNRAKTMSHPPSTAKVVAVTTASSSAH